MSDMITIPRKEYARLVEAAEDLEDIQAYDEAMRRMTNGEDELIPSELVDRLLGGESPLKIWREHRGYSQNELARLSGVNRIQIGDIEERGKTGSVVTLKRLAAALNLDVDDLIRETPAPE